MLRHRHNECCAIFAGHSVKQGEAHLIIVDITHESVSSEADNGDFGQIGEIMRTREFENVFGVAGVDEYTCSVTDKVGNVLELISFTNLEDSGELIPVGGLLASFVDHPKE